MQSIINIIIIMSINFVSCGSKYNDYTKYQTFNENELKGEGTKNIKKPCVFVKEEQDTIFVIKSNRKDEVLKYVNKGEYWCRYIKIQGKPSNLKLSTTPKIYERFITKDTIIEYYYYLEDGNRIDETIKLKINNICITLIDNNLKFSDINNPFPELKFIVDNYKENYPSKSTAIDYQPKYYYVYEKEISKDYLYVYELKGNQKRKVSINKLNSLGEFDISPKIW